MVFQHQMGDWNGGPPLKGLAASQKNRWDLTGYFQEMESLKQEAGTPERLWGKLLLNWVNEGLF